MIVTMGEAPNEDEIYDARLAHILPLFRKAHPEMQLCELPVHGKRRNQLVKNSLDFLLEYLQERYSRLPAALSFYFVMLRVIFLNITYFYSFHCILRHMFY